MRIRRLGFGLMAALVIGLAGGCKKAAPGDTAGANGESPSLVETVARVHWLGFGRLATETNAAAFMAIWKEPASKTLEAQTLDKLALALAGDRPAPYTASLPFANLESKVKNQKTAALLRPLLDDLVQAESYVEVRQLAGQPGELALAIRLAPDRAASWGTNLAAALASLSGAAPAQAGAYGWQLQLTNQQPAATRCLELTRAGEWTLLGLAFQTTNTLVADTANRIQRDRAPFGARTTNYWLEADFDPARVSRALDLNWNLPTNTPALSFNAVGDGENVITRGQASFPQSLPLALEPWNIPTNLVQGPLISFTAVRGLAPWLGKLSLFSGFPPGEVPSQMYLWADGGLPFHTFFALTSPNPTNALGLLAKPIMDWANPRIQPHCGTISLIPTNGSLEWIGLPHGFPFLEAVTNSNPQFLYGGFAAGLRPSPMPQELVAHILDITNLIYFDWEIAGTALVHWRYLDDVYRIAFDNFGPRLNRTVSLAWVADNVTNLSHCVTEVRLEPTNRLSFARKSTVGLDGLELDALANWLERPEFPRGLSTLMNTNPAPVPILRKIQHAKVKN